MTATSMFSMIGTGARSLVTGIGEAGMMLAEAFGLIFRGRIEWAEVMAQIERYGIGSLPIVALSASFIGMALSVQFAREIVMRYGAENLVGGFVALAMFRELAPVFVAIVIAGNVGASMTAEIGTMKVTDQIDAMEVFNIPPLEYLVVPRIVSTAIAGPALTVFGVFLSLLSGQLFSELMVGVPAEMFWESVKFSVGNRDIVNMLVKALVFSVTIALIASANGLATKGSSEAVGRNTTNTVVWCLLAIFALNYVLTSIFFNF